ncbi:unnamed protein product [Acanthoscelides obtectus]|uniref:Uncharacterized protein n=1 Tax=Acanthoscelides obtectus TaxID=200917 RepID=A0A9P0NUF6_ACAOB|nr:unnamed protein product [Acanthoscelides obtectus]CAK1662099.1 hypothetical protein AOBTE_LOCUS22985 [Acanthoscelides obtectus]
MESIVRTSRRPTIKHGTYCLQTLKVSKHQAFTYAYFQIFHESR